ncbi:MAG: secreted trypsin-like serine protease [Cognaticolwellia sp.]|jgi:secreted trypsin-like serine protease
MPLFASLALAQSPPPIVGGELDLENPAVGMVAQFDDLGGYIFCSGTVIEAEWVLTSASCAEQSQAHLDQGLSVKLLLGLNLSQLDEQHAVEQAFPYPQWDHVGTDVGLLKLASPAQVTPAPWNREKITAEYQGSTLSYVGFGISQSSASDAGFRRVTQVPVLRVTANAVWGYHDDIAAPRGICDQDFGGPAILELDGVSTVVGVNAEVLQDGESSDPCKGYAISPRTDVHAGWVQEVTLGLIDGDSMDSGALDSGFEELVFETEGQDCGGCGGSQAPLLPALLAAGLALLCRRKSGAVAL